MRQTQLALRTPALKQVGTGCYKFPPNGANGVPQ